MRSRSDRSSFRSGARLRTTATGSGASLSTTVSSPPSGVVPGGSAAGPAGRTTTLEFWARVDSGRSAASATNRRSVGIVKPPRGVRTYADHPGGRALSHPAPTRSSRIGSMRVLRKRRGLGRPRGLARLCGLARLRGLCGAIDRAALLLDVRDQGPDVVGTELEVRHAHLLVLLAQLLGDGVALRQHRLRRGHVARDPIVTAGAHNVVQVGPLGVALAYGVARRAASLEQVGPAI